MIDPSQEVADPTTSAERLAQLAAAHPELGAQIANHPNAYPGLRQWIASYAAEGAPTVTGETPAAAQKPTGNTARFWTRTKVLVSGLIAVVGAVTGVISVIPILTRDATNFSHLEISATPAHGEVSEWALPATALDADFPLTGTACGPAQLEWLTEHATPIQRGYMLTARNEASEGAMLALTGFRSTAQGASERGPISVRLVCDPSGATPASSYYAKLFADDPSREAVHVKMVTHAAPNSSPEIPVAFNLAPGESGKIPLELFSRNPASGRIQVTVHSRDEQRTVEIDGSDFETPALLFGGEMYLFTGTDGLNCFHAQTGALVQCTVAELRHELESVAP